MSWYKDLFNPISRSRGKTLPPVTIAKKPSAESKGSYVAPSASLPPPTPLSILKLQPLMFSGSFKVLTGAIISNGSGSYALTQEMQEAIRKDRLKLIEKFKKYSLTS